MMQRPGLGTHEIGDKVFVASEDLHLEEAELVVDGVELVDDGADARVLV
jgi:hypothetical protein